MPAKSKSQQRFMAIAKNNPSKLRGKKPSMSDDDLDDYASTPTKKLPKKVKGKK